MAEHIKIRDAGGKWVIRACDAVIAESDRALELTEGDQPAVIYFPREDVAMAFFDATDSKTTCPHKGEARYYTIHGPSDTIVDAAWSYEAPLTAVGALKDHLAFYGSRVKIERL